MEENRISFLFLLFIFLIFRCIYHLHDWTLLRYKENNGKIVLLKNKNNTFDLL